jgi:hypothetical protein
MDHLCFATSIHVQYNRDVIIIVDFLVGQTLLQQGKCKNLNSFIGNSIGSWARFYVVTGRGVGSING